jgi:hypothetical protein
MTGTPPLSPKGATTKDKAAIAGHVDQSASATLTGVQQDEVAARLATETASTAALERQKAYGAALARLAKAEEEARVAASAATPPWRAQIESGRPPRLPPPLSLPRTMMAHPLCPRQWISIAPCYCRRPPPSSTSMLRPSPSTTSEASFPTSSTSTPVPSTVGVISFY